MAPIPPPRRPTHPPYGGSEERTPLPALNLSERAMVMEAHIDRAFEAVERLSKTIDSILEVINGPPGKPEEGLLSKMYVLDQRRRYHDKVAFACVCAIAVGLLGFLLRISWIVQGSKAIP